MDQHQHQQHPQYKKFYVEWWRVSRRSIYGVVAFVLVLAAIGFGSWWAITNNLFVPKDTGEVPRDAARIISFEGDVRITRVATRETIVVTKETYVAAGDTIQTQADGRAVVQMIDGSEYRVGANSTVVIRDSSSIFGGKNVRVALDDGQINVRTDQQPENTQNVVEMMDSETRLRSQTDASFNADAAVNGGEIRISRGSVETTIGGDRATINANEFASLSGGKITAKEGLLAAPRMVSPENMSQSVDGGGGVNMSFHWQGDGAGATYYLQVARSPYFAADSILVDRGGLSTTNFRLAALSPGTYYWRLKSTTKTGQTTEWN
ncbi:MAG TPA: FecR domain-containing protein, partial [Pyrinomonadaceae bacterium]|nr:FecR domain-containing protein [Pyrinomonadaceae bacterium]